MRKGEALHRLLEGGRLDVPTAILDQLDVGLVELDPDRMAAKTLGDGERGARDSAGIAHDGRIGDCSFAAACRLPTDRSRSAFEADRVAGGFASPLHRSRAVG